MQNHVSIYLSFVLPIIMRLQRTMKSERPETSIKWAHLNILLLHIHNAFLKRHNVCPSLGYAIKYGFNILPMK
jgi:hypothetical protein